MDMEIVFPGGLRVDAIMGDMVVETNQDGSAPAPFGLFLASIGTWAGFFVLNFCEQRGLQLVLGLALFRHVPGLHCWAPDRCPG